MIVGLHYNQLLIITTKYVINYRIYKRLLVFFSLQPGKTKAELKKGAPTPNIPWEELKKAQIQSIPWVQ